MLISVKKEEKALQLYEETPTGQMEEVELKDGNEMVEKLHTALSNGNRVALKPKTTTRMVTLENTRKGGISLGELLTALTYVVGDMDNTLKTRPRLSTKEMNVGKLKVYIDV